MAFSLMIGIPSGILAAVRVNTWWDSAGKIFALLGLSLPAFWVGLVMILLFSVYLAGCPSSGSGTALHLIMPAFSLGWFFAAAHMRLTRSSMLEVLGSEYVKLARLKGLPEALVIGKHAFKNALIPVLTLAGINLVVMVNVAVVVETVFAWPGIGRLLYEGIAFRDFPVVQAVVILGGVDDRDREPARGHPVRRHRPTHPPGEVSAMNGSPAATIAVAPPLHRLRAAARRLPLDPVPHPRHHRVPRDLREPARPARSRGRDAGLPLQAAGLADRGHAEFLLGTDHLGRDVLSRLIFGARVSMVVGFVAVIVAGSSARPSGSSPAISASGWTRSSCA